MLKSTIHPLNSLITWIMDRQIRCGRWYALKLIWIFLSKKRKSHFNIKIEILPLNSFTQSFNYMQLYLKAILAEILIFFNPETEWMYLFVYPSLSLSIFCQSECHLILFLHLRYFLSCYYVFCHILYCGILILWMSTHKTISRKLPSWHEGTIFSFRTCTSGLSCHWQ